MFIFTMFHHSCPTGTPAKYEQDIQYKTSVLMILENAEIRDVNIKFSACLMILRYNKKIILYIS